MGTGNALTTGIVVDIVVRQTYYIVMLQLDFEVNVKVNVQEVKTHFSRYLDAVEKGEVVIVCRHNKPIAELRAIPKEDEQRKAPQFGLWKGFGVSESFFEPLPDDLLKAFNGE